MDKNTYLCLFFVYFICRVESAHWALKRLLQNSLGDLCSFWEAMNNNDHTDDNCGYRAIIVLLGIGEDSWSLVCNQLLKELAKCLMSISTCLVA